MSRYIKMDEFSIEPLKQSSIEFDAGILYALRKLDEQPTADAVEVVRCKDCTRQMICFHSDDYFCADGERREDDKG